MCRSDSDYADVYRKKLRRAIKAHPCYECSAGIAPGSMYEEAVSLFDGHWSRVRTCARCLAARDWLDVVCGGAWEHGAVLDDLVEHWHEGYHQLGLARIVLAARGGRFTRGRWATTSPEQIHAWVEDALAHTPNEHVGAH